MEKNESLGTLQSHPIHILKEKKGPEKGTIYIVDIESLLNSHFTKFFALFMSHTIETDKITWVLHEYCIMFIL